MNISAADILKKTEIPVIPVALQKVLSIVDDPKASGSALEQLLLKEPGLVAHLLKLVNSSYYGMPNKISSVGQAVVLLGFPTVRTTASALLMMDTFNKMAGLTKDEVLHIWRHSVATACIVKQIAKKENAKTRDDLFLAAMLHDIGHLILEQHFQQKYKDQMKEKTYLEPKSELESFGIGHDAVAAALLREWKFSESVISLIESHHDSTSFKGAPSTIHLLQLADDLASSYSNLSETLNLEEAKLSKTVNELLSVAKLSWKDLQAQKEAILSAVSDLEGLFHE